jgi:hypothetical protein
MAPFTTSSTSSAPQHAPSPQIRSVPDVASCYRSRPSKTSRCINASWCDNALGNPAACDHSTRSDADSPLSRSKLDPPGPTSSRAPITIDGHYPRARFLRATARPVQVAHAVGVSTSEPIAGYTSGRSTRHQAERANTSHRKYCPQASATSETIATGVAPIRSHRDRKAGLASVANFGSVVLKDRSE